MQNVLTNKTGKQYPSWYWKLSDRGVQTPWVSAEEVNASIPLDCRALGLTVLIDNNEWWYIEGVGDENLIQKTSGGGASLKFGVAGEDDHILPEQPRYFNGDGGSLSISNLGEAFFGTFPLGIEEPPYGGGLYTMKVEGSSDTQLMNITPIGEELVEANITLGSSGDISINSYDHITCNLNGVFDIVNITNTDGILYGNRLQVAKGEGASIVLESYNPIEEGYLTSALSINTNIDLISAQNIRLSSSLIDFNNSDPNKFLTTDVEGNIILSTVSGGGGGANFANADLIATGDRSHDFDGNMLVIKNSPYITLANTEVEQNGSSIALTADGAVMFYATGEGESSISSLISVTNNGVSVIKNDGTYNNLDENKFLSTDENGLLVLRTVSSGGSVTANNGLHVDVTTSSVYLGGTLQENSLITSTDKGLRIRTTDTMSGQDTMRITSSSLVSAALWVEGLGSNLRALNVTGVSGGIAVSAGTIGVNIVSQDTTGMGIGTQSLSQFLGSYAISAIKSGGDGVNNTVRDVLSVGADTSNYSTAVIGSGFGSAICFRNQLLSNPSSIAHTTNRLISKMLDATSTTRLSEFSITGCNPSQTDTTLLQITGNGLFTITKGLQDFADDVAAAAGSIPVNGLYRTGSAVKIRVS